MNHVMVWTGTEVIAFAGYSGTYLNTGARYNPATDSWVPTSMTNVPAGRRYSAAVWNGTEMIVWGGYNGAALNTGGRYNPATNSWVATSTVNAPEGRRYLPLVWTGQRLFVWGGRFINSKNTNTGGIYDPATDTWTATSTGTNLPQGRWNHTIVWTGDKAIVWGGVVTGGGPYLNNGAIYNLNDNSWTTVTMTGAPPVRDKHAAVWTGTEMIVWGGDQGNYHNINSGGRYNPATNTWTATSMVNVPTIRSWLTCTGGVWTGTEMIVWGGYDHGTYWTTGGRYNPTTDSWATTTATGAPVGRYEMDMVWTGSEMVLWGGYRSGYLADGSRYTPYAGILAEGSHNFKVRATDRVGNVDPTPADYSWLIDLSIVGVALIDDIPPATLDEPEPVVQDATST